MFKSLCLMLVLVLSFAVSAGAPLAKMESSGANVLITFNDFAGARAFEKYKCHIDFGSWFYNLDAIKNGANYECLEQGGLSQGIDYNVSFSFSEYPGLKTSTFILRAN